MNKYNNIEFDLAISDTKKSVRFILTTLFSFIAFFVFFILLLKYEIIDNEELPVVWFMIVLYLSFILIIIFGIKKYYSKEKIYITKEGFQSDFKGYYKFSDVKKAKFRVSKGFESYTVTMNNGDKIGFSPSSFFKSKAIDEFYDFKERMEIEIKKANNNVMKNQ